MEGGGEMRRPATGQLFLWQKTEKPHCPSRNSSGLGLRETRTGGSETQAQWAGARQGGETSRDRVEMTGTCFFTFLFLLSFLCFIKGNTKGKLCYLLKNVKVYFKREEKKQTLYCLYRGGGTLTGGGRRLVL